jgi:4-hydroxyphenylpyruvate dioxygenase
MVHRPSICTVSLGRCYAGHSLPHKLDMARKYSFEGIELFFEDLLDIANSMPGGATPTNQIAAAQEIRQLCYTRKLELICLQPFMNYEGLVDRDAHAQRLSDMGLWVKLAHALGTDLILLPSSFLPVNQVTNDMDVIVRDMIELADIGLHQTPVIRFAYEALCWGSRVDTWEASWDVIRRVNRSNFGLCLDTFNILGRIYADPAAASGTTPGAHETTSTSIRRLLAQVDVRKVFLVQMADAERLAQPLDQHHPLYSAEQPARMSWSRNARLFYGESEYGAYLPVKEVLQAIIKGLGFQGWLSFEVFNRKLADTDRSIPEELARRAAQSWAKLKQDLPLLQADKYPRERRHATL